MKKTLVYITSSCMFFLLSSFSVSPVSNEYTFKTHENSISPLRVGIAQLLSVKASLLYESMDLEEKGLSKEAFFYAYKGYEQLLRKKIITRSEYLTICDLSQSSKNRRFYLIDIANNKIIVNTYVAHGKNSGGEYARRFSNRPESHQTSLGFYITKTVYNGEHGMSLRVMGVDAGFNDRAYRRAIVIHGANYIGGGFAGRSYGCPAVPKNECKSIINTIKNGTCLFIYHPDKRYLSGSKILNG